MILELYIAFYVVAFAFLFYGWYTRSDIYRILGSFMIIVLAAMLVPQINGIAGQVQYISGTSAIVNGSSISVVNNYAVFTSPTLGFYLFLAGAMSFYLVLMDRRTGND